MDSKIIKISDDQNEIIHESGLVMVAVEETEIYFCEDCDYFHQLNCLGINIPCLPSERKDKTSKIFKIKQ